MKNLIFPLLCLCVLSAASTTYKNGGECNCDSISKRYYPSGELAGTASYKFGNRIGYKHCNFLDYFLFVIVIKSPLKQGIRIV